MKKYKTFLKKSTIALVGKYVELQDAYLSVAEALRHAGYAFDADIEIKWINAEEVTDENVAELLEMLMEFLFQVDLVIVVLKGKFLRFAMRVKTKFLSLEFV